MTFVNRGSIAKLVLPVPPVDPPGETEDEELVFCDAGLQAINISSGKRTINGFISVLQTLDSGIYKKGFHIII